MPISNAMGSTLLNPLTGATNIPNQYNPSNSFVGPIMSSSATSPSTPKTQYTQNVAQQMQNLSGQFANVNGTIYNKQTGQGYSNPQQFAQAAGLNPNNINWNNLQFDTSWKPQSTSATNNTITYPANNPVPVGTSLAQNNAGGPSNNFTPLANANGASTNISNDYTGTSTGIAGQGSYDPYNSPAYQQYLQNYVSSLQASPQEQQAQQELANVQSSEALGLSKTLGDVLPMDILTGQQNAIRSQAEAQAQIPQNALNYYQSQRQIAGQAAGAGLAAANANAGFLSGLATPTAISTGQQLTQFNPATGQTTPLANQPSFSAIANPLSPSGITTYNQNTGQQNSSLGSTPPSLGGNSSLASQYMQNPIIAGYVQATQNSGGDMNAAGVPSQYQPAVNTVLQAQSGGQYSPGNSAINYSNLQAQQSTANQLIAPLQTANEHLSDLQSLANAVGYSNSPINNQIRNQISGTLLTDPNITNLQSAIGVVRSEVAKVLGGGSPTVASQAEAADAIPDNLSPQNIAGVIANVQKLMNDKLQTYTNPENTAKLPTGLQMGTTVNGVNIPAGALSLS